MTPALIALLAQEQPPVAPEEVGAGIAVAVWLICMGLSVVVGLVSFVFWLWMLIDCIQNEPNAPDNQLMVWLIVLLIAGVVGAIIYYFVRRKPRLSSVQPHLGKA